MADQDLPIEGKDVTVELTFLGAPQNVIRSITSFTETARYDTIETKHLGTTDVDIDKIPIGWQGEIVCSRETSQLDDFIDAWNLARRNRVPAIINITSTKRYRDGSSKTHTYLDCKVEFGSRASRGSASESTISWVTGRDRI